MPLPIVPKPTTRRCEPEDRKAGAVGELRHLLRLPLGEEDVAQCGRFRAPHHGEKCLALLAQRFRKGQLHGASDTCERRRGRVAASGSFRQPGFSPREESAGTGATGKSRVRLGAEPAARSANATRAAPRPVSGASSSSRPQLTASSPPIRRPVRIMSSACLDPDQARESQVPPAPGTKPSDTSGRPMSAPESRDDGRTHRKFERAAGGRAMDRCNHWLRRAFDRIDDVDQRRSAGIGGAAELADICPGAEVLARPGENDGPNDLGARSRRRGLDREHRSERRADRVHRRAVQRQDDDAVRAASTITAGCCCRSSGGRSLRRLDHPFSMVEEQSARSGRRRWRSWPRRNAYQSAPRPQAAR